MRRRRIHLVNSRVIVAIENSREKEREERERGKRERETKNEKKGGAGSHKSLEPPLLLISNLFSLCTIKHRYVVVARMHTSSDKEIHTVLLPEAVIGL